MSLIGLGLPNSEGIEFILANFKILSFIILLSSAVLEEAKGEVLN